ncbi:MAG: hypothetical protein AAFU34_18135 [Pseudomonadota bacterium]
MAFDQLQLRATAELINKKAKRFFLISFLAKKTSINDRYSCREAAHTIAQMQRYSCCERAQREKPMAEAGSFGAFAASSMNGRLRKRAH